MRHIDVICYNGGTIRLQYGGSRIGTGWRHMYDDPTQVGDDLLALCRGENPLKDWDGNEAGEYPAEIHSFHAEHNGAYVWFYGTPRQVAREIMGCCDHSWRNVSELAKYLESKEGK